MYIYFYEWNAFLTLHEFVSITSMIPVFLFVLLQSLENATRLILVLGGSTNAVLHLLAIANAAGIKFTLNDFARLSAETPVLADLKPSGQYSMNDIFKSVLEFHFNKSKEQQQQKLKTYNNNNYYCLQLICVQKT